MYAIIQTGGKQYKVEPGQEVRVEKLEGKIGDEVFFDKVLLVSKEDALKVGKPVLENAKVAAKILRTEANSSIDALADFKVNFE